MIQPAPQPIAPDESTSIPGSMVVSIHAAKSSEFKSRSGFIAYMLVVGALPLDDQGKLTKSSAT
eukprot:3057180-Amphidinium_carterae.1